MITVFLTGGLGNQMFQYAAGKILAERIGKHLVLDISLLNVRSKNTTPRNYELHCFALNKNIKVVSSKLKGVLLKKLYHHIRGNTLIGRKIKKWFSIFADKQAVTFAPQFLQLQHKVKLLGYFQSEQYFSENETVIRDSFTFEQDFSEKNKEIAEDIKNCNAVSLHIRRGDYVHNKNAAQAFVSCSKEYYEEAIAYICERVESPRFFIFSDEPEEIKEMFPSLNAVYINGNTGATSFNDMHLMSLCKHNIMANSSFSWWGAWLNNNTEKIVIAPKKWVKNEISNNNIKDLIPQKWIRL